MKLHPVFSCFSLALAMLATSCDDGTKASPNTKPPEVSASSPPSKPARWTPAQREQAEKLGRKIAEAISDGKLDSIIDLMDLVHVRDEAFKGLDVQGNPNVSQFRAGFSDGDGMREVVQVELDGYKGWRARSIGIREIDGRECLRLRLSMEDDARYRFADWFLTFGDSGQPKITDFDDYGTGLTLVGFVRCAALRTLPALNRNFPVFTGSPDPKSIAAEAQFYSTCSFGGATEAVTAFSLLPEALQKSRHVYRRYLFALNVAKSDAAYEAALKQGRENTPEDVSLDFQSYPVHSDLNNFKEARACAARLFERFEKDATLLCWQALELDGAGDKEGARDLAGKAASLEPTHKLAQFLCLRLAVEAHDYPAACLVLSEIRGKINSAFHLNEENADYAEFAKSKEYREWVASHPVQ